MKLKFVKSVFVLCSAVLFSTAFATRTWAQATAQITGMVTDPTGAAVAGAQVTATDTATGVSRTVVSGATGEYVLPNLDPGPYTLNVTKEGFNKFVQTGITLNVAASPNVPVVLQVGNVAQQVEVTANAQMVETQQQGVSQIMENTRVIDLPLNGRNTADLVQLAGAAVTLGTSGNASSRSFQGVEGGEGYSIAGGQTSSVNYLLDGAWFNNAYDNLNLPLPFPDALQEFKLETSALSAATGVHSGGTVTAVTKSGTNDVHGDAFEFLRNLDFDARNPFSPKGSNGQVVSDGLKRNQFGGTLGGPIKNNKIFGFAGFQGTLTRQQPPVSQEFVPTAQELSGDFTTFANSTANGGCQPTAKTLPASLGFTGNKINPSLFSPAALELTSKYLPTSSDPKCGAISIVQPYITDEYQIVSRLDYHISDKNSLFTRYIYTDELKTPPYSVIPDVLETTLGGRDNLAQAATIGETYLLSDTKVNSVHVTFNRTAIHRTDHPYFDNSDVGINSYSYIPGIFYGNVTGDFSIGSGVETQSTFNTDTYSVGDDFSWVKGNHQIAFGASEGYWMSSSKANVRSAGVWTFSGQISGLAMADFLLGKASLLDMAEPNTLYMKQWYTGLYAQDSWKVTPRLTVNYGLRWEPWKPQDITNGDVYNFSLARFESGTRSVTYPNAPPGLYYPGDPGFEDHSGQNSHIADFEPRVGLAWDPFGNGKMSVRASYGLFYDFANGQFFINTTIAPPFGDEIKLTDPPSLNNPWSSYTNPQTGITGDPFPIPSGAGATFPLSAPYLATQPSMPATEIHEWNLSVQRQLGADWLVSANYIGNETEHLWASTQENPGVYIPGTCTAGGFFPGTTDPDGLTANGPCSPSSDSNLQNRRMLSLINPTYGQYYGYVDYFDAGATQSYNGVIFQVQHRLANGLVLSGNETWSHCIGIYSQEFTTPNPGTGFQFPNDMRADRGDCVFDHRNVINASATYALPRFSNSYARAIGTGWNVSLIYTYFSGDALTVTTGTDQNGMDNTATQRPLQESANPYGGGYTVHYLNPAAFQEPTFGNNGNMGMYSLTGPAVWNTNLAIFRTFPIKERFNLEIRGEAFNALNNLQRGDPTTALNSTNFGNITALASGGPEGYNPRELQLSAKILF